MGLSKKAVTTTPNTRHLKYIGHVLDEDFDEIKRKEKTYDGSWKKRGGVGAFMMLARKWDRMETMVKDASGNFTKDMIRLAVMEENAGEDGTMLAEIRDLRRYLTLVESEVILRRPELAERDGKVEACPEDRYESEMEKFPEVTSETVMGHVDSVPPSRAISPDFAELYKRHQREDQQTAHYTRVKEFMIKADQSVPDGPVHMDWETRKLRAKLIFEECMETIKALGFTECCDGNFSDFFDHNPDNYNPIEILDGCADIKVVVTGTLVSMGVPDVHLQAMIDEANLAKFDGLTVGDESPLNPPEKLYRDDMAPKGMLSDPHGQDIPGWYKEDGKLIKSADWKAPDLSILIPELVNEKEKETQKQD